MRWLCPDKRSHCVDTAVMNGSRPPVELSEQIDDRSAKGIAAAVGRMISSGQLAVGSRLPRLLKEGHGR